MGFPAALFVLAGLPCSLCEVSLGPAISVVWPRASDCIQSCLRPAGVEPLC